MPVVCMPCMKARHDSCAGSLAFECRGGMFAAMCECTVCHAGHDAKKERQQ